jgi:hypothetical protein
MATTVATAIARCEGPGGSKANEGILFLLLFRGPLHPLAERPAPLAPCAARCGALRRDWRERNGESRTALRSTGGCTHADEARAISVFAANGVDTTSIYCYTGLIYGAVCTRERDYRLRETPYKISGSNRERLALSISGSLLPRRAGRGHRASHEKHASRSRVLHEHTIHTTCGASAIRQRGAARHKTRGDRRTATRRRCRECATPCARKPRPPAQYDVPALP